MGGIADLIQGAYDAFARGDIPAVIDTLSDDVRWDVAAVLPQGGSFQGKDGVGQFFEGLGQAWEELNLQIEDLIEGRDDVVGVGRAEGRLGVGGTSAGYGFAHVFTVEDGKVTRFREYADPDVALLQG